MDFKFMDFHVGRNVYSKQKFAVVYNLQFEDAKDDVNSKDQAKNQSISAISGTNSEKKVIIEKDTDKSDETVEEQKRLRMTTDATFDPWNMDI